MAREPLPASRRCATRRRGRVAKPGPPYNPYQRSAPETPAQAGTRRDLRKLSKWIKLMREVEERKLLDKEEAEKPRED